MFRVAARALFTVALLAGVSACAVSPYEDGYYGGGGGYYGGGGGYYAGGGYAYRPAPAWGYGYSRPYYPAPYRPPPGAWGGGRPPGGGGPPAMAARPMPPPGGGGMGAQPPGGAPPRPSATEQFFRNENQGGRAEGGGPN